MIEGTRMSIVFTAALTKLIAELSQASKIAGSKLFEESSSWTSGVVYTAYSNSAGISYLKREFGAETRIAKTGIKFVDHAARQFTFGVFFEANGHGDITFDINYVNDLKIRYLSSSEYANNLEFKNALDSFFDFLSIVNDVHKLANQDYW